MSSNAIVKAVQAELQHYPGVAMSFQNGGKHDRIVFERGESSRFLTVPKTPSDWRAQSNALRDFKKTMQELGALRIEQRHRRPNRPIGKMRKGAVAHFGMNDKIIYLHIPKTSKLLRQFRTADGKAAAHWHFELRSSPDLQAPPLLVARKAEVTPGKQVEKGVVAGFNVDGAWRVTMARSGLPALDKRVDEIGTVSVTLYEDNGKELVFKLPAGTIPTGFTKPEPAPAAEAKAPLPSQAWVEPDNEELPEPAPAPRHAPAPEPAPVAAAAQLVGLPTGPIALQLQYPKQSVSIEQALTVLNKAKHRLGNNLRFTIEEGGYLTAVHKLGR